MSPRSASDAAAPTVSSADLTAELAAMQRVALALDDLGDPHARERVVRWAMERVLPAVASRPGMGAPAPPLLPIPSTAPLSACDDRDVTLTVDDIDEFFEDPAAVSHAQRSQPAAGEPVDAMVKSFVADFQQIVREWNGV